MPGSLQKWQFEFADFDGDGRADVVDRDPQPDLVAWVHDPSYGPCLLVWPGRGDGRFEGPTLVPTAGSEGLVADLESDGKIELVLDNYWRSRPVVVRQP